ncbi:phosphate-starvation-inducible PsiE family protein [Pyrococcus sp. ST04]|uniref:phosphate-starvation-inducible PsiE family protein n=1 Tax=Pyrococcus sp. ST04 TaxID=1183377 RepID=UPI0002605BE4|nr:phosphate-starvation-inducible PsiE family protein [Pyrococcus sp. ST04]AFK22912.1 hypothetical protein Py04_1338 [Pyrococcus sp. ST04]
MRDGIISVLESVFDVIVGILEVIIIGFIGLALYKVLNSLILSNLEVALENFLLVLILLELYELLSLYLKEHHVSMRRVAELGIMAIVRKIMVVKSIEPLTLFGLAAIVLVLGWIYVNLTKGLHGED